MMAGRICVRYEFLCVYVCIFVYACIIINAAGYESFTNLYAPSLSDSHVYIKKKKNQKNPKLCSPLIWPSTVFNENAYDIPSQSPFPLI